VAFAWYADCVIGFGVHLFVSLAAHGWHPAAWRLSGQPGFAGAAPFLRAARIAERGALDAVLLGFPTAPRALRASGRIDGLHLDPLPLAGPAETAGRFQRADLALDSADAAARFVELIEVARQLWDSWEDRGFVVDQSTGTFADPAHVHPIEHAGRFFTVRGPLNVPRPVQGQPVILHRDVPAAARADLAASAEIVLGAPATLAEARTARAQWQALKPGVRYIARLDVILGESEAAAAKRAAELDVLASDGRPRFVGTPDQLAAHVAAWQASGACDGFDILPAVMPLDLELFVTMVVPLLRARGLRPAGYAGRTLREHLQIARPPSRFAA